MNSQLDFDDIKMTFLEFRKLHKSIRELTGKKGDLYGLSQDQCYLLVLIEHMDHPNQKMLAERLKITPATLSVRLQRLEKAGFIEKIPNENDKRNFTLHITDKGKQTILNCKDEMINFSLRLFEGINKEDLDRMKTYCQILKKNIQSMKGEFDVKD